MNAKALEIDFIIQNRSHHVHADISIMYMCNFMQTNIIQLPSNGHRAQRKTLFLIK